MSQHPDGHNLRYPKRYPQSSIPKVSPNRPISTPFTTQQGTSPPPLQESTSISSPRRRSRSQNSAESTDNSTLQFKVQSPRRTKSADNLAHGQQSFDTQNAEGKQFKNPDEHLKAEHLQNIKLQKLVPQSHHSNSDKSPNQRSKYLSQSEEDDNETTIDVFSTSNRQQNETYEDYLNRGKTLRLLEADRTVTKIQKNSKVIETSPCHTDNQIAVLPINPEDHKSHRPTQKTPPFHPERREDVPPSSERIRRPGPTDHEQRPRTPSPPLRRYDIGYQPTLGSREHELLKSSEFVFPKNNTISVSHSITPLVSTPPTDPLQHWTHADSPYLAPPRQSSIRSSPNRQFQDSGKNWSLSSPNIPKTSTQFASPSENTELFVRRARLEDTLNFDQYVNTYGPGINFRRISLHDNIACRQIDTNNIADADQPTGSQLKSSKENQRSVKGDSASPIPNQSYSPSNFIHTPLPGSTHQQVNNSRSSQSSKENIPNYHSPSLIPSLSNQNFEKVQQLPNQHYSKDYLNHSPLRRHHISPPPPNLTSIPLDPLIAEIAHHRHILHQEQLLAVPLILNKSLKIPNNNSLPNIPISQSNPHKNRKNTLFENPTHAPSNTQHIHNSPTYNNPPQPQRQTTIENDKAPPEQINTSHQHQSRPRKRPKIRHKTHIQSTQIPPNISGLEQQTPTNHIKHTQHTSQTNIKTKTHRPIQPHSTKPLRSHLNPTYIYHSNTQQQSLSANPNHSHHTSNHRNRSLSPEPQAQNFINPSQQISNSRQIRHSPDKDPSPSDSPSSSFEEMEEHPHSRSPHARKQRSNSSSQDNALGQHMVNTMYDISQSLIQMGGKKATYQNIPKFAGDDLESYEQWIAKFHSAALLYDWPIPKQLLLLHQALTDRAYSFYTGLPATDRNTLEKALIQLSNRFGLKSKSIMMRLQELTRQQAPNESVANYSKDMISILNRLEMTDESANINQYLSGLRADIREKMLLMKPTSLRDAELNALLLEKSIKDSPATKLLDDLKSLTDEIRLTHAKALDSALAVQKQAAITVAQAELATTFAVRPSTPDQLYTRPQITDQSQQQSSQHQTDNTYPKPPHFQSSNYQPRNSVPYRPRYQGPRYNNSTYQNTQTQYQPSTQNTYQQFNKPPFRTQYQSQYPQYNQTPYQSSNQQNFQQQNQSRYLKPIQNNPNQTYTQGQYKQQPRNYGPFCNRCNTSHPWAQHIIGFAYNNAQQTTQQPTSFRPYKQNLNQAGQASSR